MHYAVTTEHRDVMFIYLDYFNQIKIAVVVFTPIMSVDTIIASHLFLSNKYLLLSFFRIFYQDVVPPNLFSRCYLLKSAVF